MMGNKTSFISHRAAPDYNKTQTLYELCKNIPEGAILEKSFYRNVLNPLKRMSWAAVFLLCDLSTVQTSAVSQILALSASGFMYKV